MVLMANMQIERRRVSDCFLNHQLDRGLLMESSTPPSKCYSNYSSPVVSRPCSISAGGGRWSVGGGCLGYIEHTVSKFDTLVGVAIKYGVEVVDIKRMNGLTTDRQMFALKSLKIPLPGRHPPSPIMSNGPTNSVVTPVSDRNSDFFNSIKSLKLSSSSQRTTPFMNSLQSYHARKSNDQNGVVKSLEMAVYYEGSDKEDGSEKLVRRRKSEVEPNNHIPELMVVKEDNSSNKRNLGSRQKAGSRSCNDAEALKDALTVETSTVVRKSSSSPSFEDSGNNNSSSIWPTSMLSLTVDLQAAIPIFDGLPKPNSGRKNKAALD